MKSQVDTTTSATERSISGFLDDGEFLGGRPVVNRKRTMKTGTTRMAIIGGGLSGSLVALNLLHQEIPSSIAITLVEKDRPAGVGVAYSTGRQYHLLNVPANRMGAPPNDPGHFVRWLERKGITVNPAGFEPRGRYGEYIRDLLVNASARVTNQRSIGRVHDEAIDLVPTGEGDFEVRTRSGRAFGADRVVLALGNYPPPNPRLTDMSFTGSPRYHRNPWAPDTIQDLRKDETVFIIGTGLTMVDVVLTLRHRQHRGQVIAVSTHGYVPQPHKPTSPYPSFIEELQPLNSTLDLLKVIRKHIRLAEGTGTDWRAVVDSLRPHTQEIWLRLPLEEKHSFLAHLRHLWGVARHRMPPECAQIIDEMATSGQLRIEAGRITRLSDQGGNIEVEYLRRDNSESVVLNAGSVINCTGPESNLNKIKDPLIENLLKRGLIRNDDLSMGIDALPNGSVINREGVHSDNLYTLGPPLKGILWESTAVPEIRQQAHDLANLLHAAFLKNTNEGKSVLTKDSKHNSVPVGVTAALIG